MSNQKMREALERIAAWNEHSSDLVLNRGSNGVRDYYRVIAEEALAQPDDVGLTDDEILEAANEAYRALPEDADEQDEIIAVSRAVIQLHEAKKNGVCDGTTLANKT